jgi:hypothetical protein
MDEDRQRERKHLVDAITSFQSFDEGAFSRQELGALNFKALLPMFTATRQLLRSVTPDVVAMLPRPQVTELASRLEGFTTATLKRVAEWKLDDPATSTENLQPRQYHSQTVERFESFFNDFVPRVWPLASLGALAKLQTSFDESGRGSLDAAMAKYDQLTADAQLVLSNLREEAGKKVVTTYAQNFEGLGTRFREASERWLIAIFAGCGVLVGFGFWLVLQTPQASTPAELVGQLAGRLAILTALVYAVGLASRNYRASKHNELVNGHREVALRSLETIRDAAGDVDTKNAILLRTTEAIFQHQGTGYGSGDVEPAPLTNTIVEILRRGSGADKP